LGRQLQETEMGLAVVTVAAGGMPVIDVTSVTPKAGLPVTEAANGYGIAVTKVAAGGMPVMYAVPPLIREAQNARRADRG
jgi:hypothetical protein